MTQSDDRDLWRLGTRNKSRVRQEVDEEIQTHLDARIAQLERQGLSPAAAREEALRLFGDLEETKKVCLDSDWRRERHVRRKEYYGEMKRDIIHALRQLRRRPGFALVAILTLGVGIGANTAVFSAADHVLLRPLPYADIDRVVTLWETERGTTTDHKEVSPGNMLDWRERSSSFEHLAVAEPYGFDITGDGPPTPLHAWLISEGFFEALGVEPILGRNFVAEEFQPNSGFVVLLSYGLWQRHFGSNPSIVGQTIQIDHQAATVVGVLPPELEYPEPRDIWAPKWFRESELTDRYSDYMFAVGRLAPGVSVAGARADMDRIAAAMSEEFPRSNINTGVNVIPLEQQILGDVRPALLVLLAAVGLLLLIACANVATLLLARGAEREREFGLRAALGAGRARLVRQLVSESVLLAAAGGAVGLLLANVGVRALTALMPPELPRVGTIAIDGRVLAFAVIITVLTALLFGLAPSMRFSQPDLRGALAAGGRSSTGGRQRTRLHRVLVVSEIALALILLVGAGLLVRSYMDLVDNDLGFATDNRATIQMFLYDQNPTPIQRYQRAIEMEERLEATPGVANVAIISALPFHPHKIGADATLRIEGRPQPAPGEDRQVFTTVASPDLFRLMGIQLRSGREFTADDRADGLQVAIINESLRRRFFPNENPIGKQVTIGVMAAPVTREIVGVVADVRPTTLDSDPQPELFVPFAQSMTGAVTFVVETQRDAAALMPTLRNQVWQVDPNQTIYYAATVEELISDTLVERRFHLVLLAVFSAVALVLATIGIYGLISFSASRRTNEIGVRMALGAKNSDVVGMILRDGVRMSLAGVAFGIAGAFALTRFMGSMLYGVAPTDILTYGLIAALMLAVSAAAAYVPAQRAANGDPLAALREE
jgi:putative ABC transport system permease protein